MQSSNYQITNQNNYINYINQMGNVLSQEEINKRIGSINKLKYIVKTEFNLDNFRGIGPTQYLDSIDPNWIDPNTNVIKGIDSYNRPFFAFFAIVIMSDGSQIETFTTFFQRYSDNDVCWMFCGNLAQPLFFSTGTGGASTNQFELLFDLFSNGKIIIQERNLLENIGIRSEIYSQSFNEFKNIESPHPIEIFIGRQI